MCKHRTLVFLTIALVGLFGVTISCTLGVNTSPLSAKETAEQTESTTNEVCVNICLSERIKKC